MSYEVTGKLVAVFDTAQVTASFKKREFAIEKTDDIGGRVISNYIKFQCVQDKTEMLNRFKLGDEVKFPLTCGVINGKKMARQITLPIWMPGE